MFDLDRIEEEWKSLNLKLSEEEILEIFKSEDATLGAYNKMLNEYKKTIPEVHDTKTAEFRMLQSIWDIRTTPKVTAEMSDEEFEHNWELHRDRQLKNAEEDYYEFFDYEEIEEKSEEQLKEIATSIILNQLKEERKEYEQERKYLLEKKARSIKLDEYNELTKTGKKHLSPENQKRVVTGSLDIVFDQTRYWYDFFDRKISQETLYYICLHALMKSIKYLCHSSKIFIVKDGRKLSLFRMYVEKCISDSIIQYLARKEHIDYREAYRKLMYRSPLKAATDFKLDYEEEKEILFVPREIENLAEVNYNYTDNISSAEFIKAYNNALKKLSFIEKTVMDLSYDEYGYPKYTYEKISEFLGLTPVQVANIKKQVISFLQNDYNLIQYKLELDGHLNTSMLSNVEKRIMNLTIAGLDMRQICDETGFNIDRIAKIRSNAFKKMSIFEKKKKTQLRKEIQEKEREEKIKRKLKVKEQVNYESEYEELPFL